MFDSTNTAGNSPDVSLKVSAFVTTRTDAKMTRFCWLVVWNGGLFFGSHRTQLAFWLQFIICESF